MADELTIAMRLRGARAVNSQLAGTSKEIDRINAAARRSTAPLGRMSKSLERTGAVLTRRLTLPILVAGGFAVKMSMDFDTSLRKIVGLVGISRKTVFGWKNDMRDLSRETGVGLEDIAQGMFFITSAGFRGAAALRIMRAAAIASAAGLGDMHTVADAVTSAVNAYGEGTLKASKATDILVAGVREGKMPVDALAGAVGSVLGVASEVGVSFAEVTATAATLSRVGAPVNRTMTGIRFMLTSLVNPSGKAAKALKSVGLSSDDIRDSLKKRGLIRTLQDLKAKLPIQDFLKVVGGARGVIVGLGLVGKHANAVNGILDRTEHSTGSTSRAFKAMAEGPGFKMHKAINSLKVSLEELGDVLAPTVVRMAQGIGKIADAFSGLGKAGVVLLAGLALLGPMLKVVSFGLKVFRAQAMLAAGAEFGATAGATSLTAALLACPVTWIVLGLAAIAIGLFILYKRVKVFRDTVQGTFKWIKAHWRLLAVLLGGPVGLAIVSLVNHFKTLRHWAEAVYKMVMRIVHAIGRIKFPHVPGSGFLKKGAGLLGKGAGIAEGILGGAATGGTIMSSGRWLVGEKGPEVVTLPRGAHVEANGGGGGELVTVPVVLTLDGRVIAESTARVTADRRARR
jgi:TP901 family phage tail tape measure protein